MTLDVDVVIILKNKIEQLLEEMQKEGF